ncbi:hypothetical protein DY000_02027243 [Brassica cretica]|uniref:Uncharacterized protein n=2 Tax=Brassica cretica TaxID=69181 RepID=A0ABQ7EH27_BRACR|nr:hypothetical protein DY000_02027243 [Brassica cretica]
MDDSEKRKQILKAMRMEAAAQNDCSEGSETSMNTGHLSNPLAEASTHQQESCEAPRFDYYTDPMSAYSSFKRNNTSKQEHISFPGNQMSPPAHQLPPSVPGSLGGDYQAHANHGGFQEAHCGGDNLHTEPRGVAPSHRGSPVPWNNNYRPPPPPFNHSGPPQWVPRSFPFSQGNHDMGGIIDLVAEEAATTIPLRSFPNTDHDKLLAGLETHILAQQEGEAEDATQALDEVEEEDTWNKVQSGFTPTPWLKIHGSILSQSYGRAVQ